MSAAKVAMQTIGLILLLASTPLRAGMLDDITRNVSDSVSNATRKGIDSLGQGVSSAIDKATTPAAEATPAPAAAEVASVPAGATVPGSNQCLKINPRGDVSDFTNTCAIPVWIVFTWQPRDGCVQEIVGPGQSRIMATAAKIHGVCRNETYPIKGPGQCGCKAGDSIAEAGSTPTAAAVKAGQDKLAKGVADFHTQCVNSSQLNGLHECECLTEGYRQRATRSGSTILSMKDQNELLQTCPASHEVTKAWVFQSCDAFMQHKRSDHVEFCNCTGDYFATKFRATPLFGLRQIEALRKESMQACGLADKSHNLH
ncbi:MAG TPA: hypothetical protein DIW52_03265 [Pseudomonas sp.]|jgi:hypothetical protein|nr:hypothetical protein [Pseudomonas sp.]